MKYMCIFLLVFLLGGCSPANKENISNIESLTNEFPANDIRLIDIHLYRSDSHKTQPELINVFSDEKEKNNVIRWTNTIHKRQDIIIPNINKIYVLQFHYPNGSSEISKYLAYVEGFNGNYYAKKIEMKAELLNYENFTKGMLASVIEKIGEKDWFAVEKLVILTP